MKRQCLFLFTFFLIIAASIPLRVHAQEPTPTTTFFVAEDGSFSATLPEGWVATSTANSGFFGPAISIMNDEALLTSRPTEPGQRGFVVGALDMGQGFGNATPVLELASWVTTVIQSVLDPSVVISEPEEVVEGQVVRISFSDDLGEGLAYVALNFAPNHFGVVLMLTPTGEMTPESELEMLEIATSVQYRVPLNQPFTAADGGLEFLFPANSYPLNWVVTDLGDGVVAIFNSEAAQANAIAEKDIAKGEARFGIIGIDPLNVPAELTPDSLQAFAVQAATELSATSEHNPVIGKPEWLENELLIGGAVTHVTVTTDIGEGGVILVNNEGVLYVVLYSGTLDEGNRLFGTALAISQSITYTPVTQ